MAFHHQGWQLCHARQQVILRKRSALDSVILRKRSAVAESIITSHGSCDGACPAPCDYAQDGLRRRAQDDGSGQGDDSGRD